MSALPSGTVTFLFTDIERSTQTVEAMGNEAYADALDTHRQLLRGAFKAHGGHEVGTEGDAFFVAFERPHDAVHAAVDGQRALDGHALRVRMGVHTGEALVRQDDYVGHDVHKAKRICDAGHGGQVLLSQTTADLVRDALPLIDLGFHRLKDLGEAQSVYQVTAEGLQTEFAGLRSLDAFRHNLPAQRSTFVGRESEIAAIRKQLDVHRLITLTGIGGCGKTRLALQVGAELIDHYRDGVFFVDLAPISDPGVIGRTAATALGISQGGTPGSASSDSGLDVVVDFLRTRECLLIVDNCEHMLDDCAEMIDRILETCTDVTVLVTSREALEVEGEQSWRVPSLSVPKTLSAAADSEAVSLFTARAQAAEPDFDLTPRNVEAVAEICRRLDGIPLAIELAAARVSHLSPKQIADRLSDVFRLLTGGRRRIQRQQTLQGALDWSHDLLDEPERVLFRRLAVFSGGFFLEAAEAICAEGGESVVDLLRSLVGKSLVSADRTAHEEVRYRLLETVRLYAEEKLREASEAQTFRARHRDWFFSWVASHSDDDLLWAAAPIIRVQRELDNLRGAVEWCVAEERPELVAPVAGRLLGVWWAGHYEEGTRWLTTALSRPEALDPDDRAACLVALWTTRIVEANTTGRSERDLLAEALDATGDRVTTPLVIAKTLNAFNQSVVAAATQRDEDAAKTRALAAEAIELSDRLGEPGCKVYARVYAAGCDVDMGDVRSANERLSAMVDLLDPDRVTSLAFMGNALLAISRYALGDHAGALEAALRLRDGRDAHTELREIIGYQAEASIALARAGLGDREGAKEAMADALRIAVDSGTPFVVNEALFYAAGVEVELGGADRASRLLAAGVRPGNIGATTGMRSPPGLVIYMHTRDAVRRALPPDERRRLREEGRAMSLDHAVAYALDGFGA